MIWQLVTVGNLLTALTYSVIAVMLAVRLRRTGQLSLRANPLGVAMMLVFGTVAVRSAWTGAQMLLPLIGVEHQAALALRDAYTVASVPLPFIAAAAGLMFLWLRRRADEETGPASLYPDHALQRHRALEINDNIVQGLLAARELDALGQEAEAREVLADTLAHAQRMMGELLDGDVRPGALRRTAAA
ncbi:hypothetical protein OJ997_09980 [Solirubrobacter phytolaccae]|uniref:Uncharacterized protein n=1 Tax=Solirubrobacter phytolaccae TaxID=1404360 RepID=A0A9X3S743_9ACTN|nr:hypothetical protein [Solirubrobacter phytolaccae]MDA0180619.1 hypothetical protein [Solirubrobacter phytolaccae]